MNNTAIKEQQHKAKEEPMVKKKERIISLDVIRVLATLLVISSHFFLYIEFYSTPMKRMG